MRTRSEHGDGDLASLMQRLMGAVNAGGGAESLRIQQEAGLTFPQIIALYVLDGAGPRTVSQIAESTGLSAPAASQLVDRMVQQALATRRESAEDRRVRIVEIAPAGRALLHKLHAVRHREWEHALGRLPPTTRQRLHAVMREVVDALEAGGRAGTRR